jgi:UPF0176 protein
MTFTNTAAYKFIRLADLPQLKQDLLVRCKTLHIKGTILLSPEGINLMLSAKGEAMAEIKAYLASLPEFQRLVYKDSYSEQCAFKRLFIKLKREIISLRRDDIDPMINTGSYLSPMQFKQWLAADKDMVVLDTRNTFEVEYGTFKQAVNLELQSFTEFPAALEKLAGVAKNTPVVMFCTGGIRCEKASAVMLQQGYSQVFQLEGGILNYFQQCGGEHFQGTCFVFDERVALNSQLEPIAEV